MTYRNPKSSNGKTILIPLPYGIGWKTILNEKSIKYLSGKGFHIVLLVESEDMIPNNSNITVRPLRRYTRNRWEIALGILRNIVFADTSRPFSETLEMKIRIYSREHPRIGLMRRLLGKRMGKNTIVKKTLSWADKNLFPDRFYQKLFYETMPDAVFILYPFSYHVYPILRRASKNKVQTIAYVPSWDNLTSKWDVPAKIDRLIVWNEVMKQEAIQFLGYDRDDVKVSGVPQFDLYASDRTIMTREQFIRIIGGDQKKKILTYTTGTPQLSAAEPDIVEIIYNAIKSGEIKGPCQLILRLHPRRNIEDFSKLIEKEDLIVQTPGKISQEFSSSGYFWVSNVTDYGLLANTLAHSDVMINVASTITVESCIFDTPVVNVGFDGGRNVEYWKSVRRHFDYTHYRSIVKSKGVRIARDREQLINYINTYLENPDMDSEGRMRIMENQCYKIDGKSLDRVLSYVAEFLDESKTSRALV